MADAKFGRLFTEADVRTMLIEAACDGMDGPPGRSAGVIADRVLRLFPTTFPADEPLFLLRGQDRFALGAVWAYIEALAEGVPLGEHGRAAYHAWQAMCRWQQRHPSRLKVPD